MIAEYIIVTSNPSAYDPGDYQHVHVAGPLGEDTVLDVLHDENPLKAGDQLVGGWDQDGQRVAPLDLQLWEQIRPLGNRPPGATRGGEATPNLLFHYFSGWAQRQLGDNGALFPADNNPFLVETRWKYFEDAWPGWGWRAELDGQADMRDPTARAIAWYSDPECTQYVATTGAFQRGPSDWQVDGNGEPLDVWFSETPPGFRKAEQEPWHLAVLFGSAQEGYFTLSASAKPVRRLHWQANQTAKGKKVKKQEKQKTTGKG